MADLYASEALFFIASDSHSLASVIESLLLVNEGSTLRSSPFLKQSSILFNRTTL
jgi:hypothetical protein